MNTSYSLELVESNSSRPKKRPRLDTMALDTGIRMEEDVVDVPKKASPPAAPKPAPKLFSNRIIVRPITRLFITLLQVSASYWISKC